MRFFTVTADIVLGLALGLFLYVAAARTWPVLERPWVAGLIFAAAVLAVLFRRPNGSLASPRRPDR